MFMQHHTKPRQITKALPLPRIRNATILISKVHVAASDLAVNTCINVSGGRRFIHSTIYPCQILAF